MPLTPEQQRAVELGKSVEANAPEEMRAEVRARIEQMAQRSTHDISFALTSGMVTGSTARYMEMHPHDPVASEYARRVTADFTALLETWNQHHGVAVQIPPVVPATETHTVPVAPVAPVVPVVAEASATTANPATETAAATRNPPAHRETGTTVPAAPPASNGGQKPQSKPQSSIIPPAFRRSKKHQKRLGSGARAWELKIHNVEEEAAPKTEEKKEVAEHDDAAKKKEVEGKPEAAKAKEGEKKEETHKKAA